MTSRTRFALLAALFLLVGGVAAVLTSTDGPAPAAPPAVPPLPGTLGETGLYADGTLTRVAADVLPFAPQYPLWSDGAAKRRWVRLPPGTAIDGTDPDDWRFPVGTRFWKEFAFGRRVETRLLEKLPDATWRFATYLWSPDGTSARLAPDGGVRGAHAIRPGLTHDVPSRTDCLACHGARAERVLGFTALQLSPDRDPLAPHVETPPPGAVDLATLEARGLLRTSPQAARAPRIAARTARERAALGYLHANCGSCHAAHGPLADLGLALDVRGAGSAPSVFDSALGHGARFRLPGAPGEALLRLHPGRPDASLLLRRAASRQPAVQMPPLGTKAVDAEALALLEAWIREDLAVSASPAGPTD